ncbi:unnamed protein product [Thlaspi arvense]|uniref:Reverse transcriptase domain-containing protein n=1 Tax=Thlaspi arvense TaxID=13288 RepID=A0AAU9S9E9_THLAR|nr:unnamed protein product [Thlaspi arvense]
MQRDMVTLEKNPMEEQLFMPGSFTLQCRLGNTIFEDCLFDLGASLNVMFLATSNHLSYYHYMDIDMVLGLADGSERKTVEKLTNLLVMIGNVLLPTNFVVIGIREDEEEKILLEDHPYISRMSV